MINTVTELKISPEYTNVAEVEAGKVYQLSFKLDKTSIPHIHLHTEDQRCICPIPVSSEFLIANRTYRYPIIPNHNGYISIKTTRSATMYDIVIEEV